MHLLSEPTRYRRWYGQEASTFLNKIHFHHAAANAADKFAVCTNRHLVTLTTGTAPRTLGDDEQHHQLLSHESFVDELPQFEFFVHAGILA